LRVLFLGAGGVGGYYGGRLIQFQSAQVTFLVRTQQQVETLKRNGLRIKTATQEEDVLLHGDSFHALCSTEESDENVYDVIFLCCKAYDLTSACDTLEPFIQRNPSAIILPLLNGLKHLQYLDERFGKRKIVAGVSHVATTLQEFGVIQQITPVHRITFGIREGNSMETLRVLERLKEAFSKTCVEVILSKDIEQELWEKFVLLTTLAASTCLSRAAVGDMMNTDDGEQIILSILEECTEAAKFANHTPRPSMVKGTYNRLTERGSLLTASMLRDLEANKPTEGRHIIFDMLERSRKSGSRAPYLSMAWMVLQARDERLKRESKL
jgi:2-dehydropantoate 2-reductase